MDRENSRKSEEDEDTHKSVLLRPICTMCNDLHLHLELQSLTEMTERRQRIIKKDVIRV